MLRLLQGTPAMAHRVSALRIRRLFFSAFVGASLIPTVCLLLALASPSWGAVTVDAVGTPQWGTGTSANIPITLGAVSNSAVVLYFSGNGATTAGITASIGGVTLSIISGSDGNNLPAEVLLGAVTTLTGAQTVSVSWNTSQYYWVNAVSFHGVNQTTPFNGGMFGYGASPYSKTITSNSGDLTTTINGTTATATTNQTQKWSVTGNGSTIEGDVGPGTGTTTHTWTSAGQTMYVSGANIVAAAGTQATPTRVQANVCRSTGQQYPTCNWNAATTTGNLLLMVVATSGATSAPTITPADSTWVKVDATNYPYYPGSAAPQVGMWYIANATSRSGTETVNLSGAKDTIITLIEVTGMATSLVVDRTQKNGSTSTATTVDSGTTATTTQANEYWLAVGVNRYETPTLGAATGGFTNITPTTGTNPWATTNSTSSNGIGFVVADQVVSATGAAHATWSLSTARAWTGIVATFKAATCAAVSDATYVAANAQPTQAIVYWSSSNPVLILRKSGTPISDVPAPGRPYSVGYNFASGTTVVYNGSAPATSFTDSGLTNGTTYYYQVFANSSACYAPGTSTAVVARPAASSPAWSYNLAGGSMLVAGIAGSGTIYTGSNASQIIGLSTADGTQLWTPAATTRPIQGWLTWLPTYGGWPYRKPITIDHTKVTATLTNFPVLINLTTDTDLHNYAQASGNDIFFTAADGATKLDHEIETYNSGTGQLVAWVQVPSLSNTTDTTIYMYYGNPTAPNQQNVPGTWDANYMAVWHLQQSGNGTAGEFTDSTGPNDGQGGAGSSAATPAQAAGEIGYGQNFGGNDYIQVANSTSLNTNITSQLTMEAWVKLPSPSTNQKLLGKTPIGSGYLLAVQTGGLYPEIWDSAGTDYSFTSGTITANQWTHLAVTWTTGGSMIGYVNGAQVNSIPASTNNIGGTTNVLDMGKAPWGSSFYTTGYLDEARISNIARSADWIKTEYNNQCPACTFYTVGSAQPNSDAVVLGADQSGRVYAVDAGGGTSIWQVTPGDLFQASVAAQLQQWASTNFQTTYNDDVLFVPTRNASTTTNKLYALKRNSGATAWSFGGVSTGNSVDIIVGMPWVDYTRDRVYVVSHSNSGAQPSLWVINSLTGAKVASFNLGDIEASPTMSMDGRTVYVGTKAGRLYAVDMSTLALKWSGTGYVNLGTNVAVQGFIWENGDIPGRLYFATSDGNVWGLQDPCNLSAGCSDNTQAPPSYLWKTAVAAPSTPLPLGNPAAYLYVGSSDGYVHKLDLNNNGQPAAVNPTTMIGDGSKQVGDVSTETGNEIFVGTTEGTLYKLSPAP